MEESKTTIQKIPDRNVAMYERTASDILKITEDKLELKLIKLKDSIENKSNIFCYFGMTLTIIIVLITASFKDFIFSSALWQAIFIVSLVLLALLTIKSIIIYHRNKKDIKSVIQEIKEV
jgi:uncharacterized membrane protein YqjE